MKKLFTFLAATCLIATLHAKIVYLNSELEEPNISENLYTKWSDAYAAVSDGDTIYVAGSTFNYGDIELDKGIFIIGPGYFLNENVHTQFSKKIAKVGWIYLRSGSEGSHIRGLTMMNWTSEIIISNNVSDIIIESCYVPKIEFASGNGSVNNNIQIRKCYVYDSRSFVYNDTQNGFLNNAVISNNIVVGNVSVPDGSNGVISNNLFISNRLYLGSSSSFEFTNNIYLNENEDRFTIQPLPDASVSNNISLTGAFGNDNDNFSAPQSTLFVSDENASTDGQYMLSEDSPAKGAGTNGTDIGPFGGPDPYRLSGLPNLPNIYELSTGGFVSGDELSVQIKIKQ